MKKIFQYTFRILSVVLLLAAVPCFSSHATGETTDNILPAPDTSQTENPPAEIIPSVPSEEIDVTQPDAPADNTQPDALPPVAPEVPAPDSAAPDPITDTEQETFTVTDFSGTYYVATENDLNVRSGPSTSHALLGKLSSGQEITVTGRTDNDWYRIQYKPGQEGYVSAQYLSDVPVSSTPEPDEDMSEAPAETMQPESIPEPEPEDDMSDDDIPETEEEPSTYIEISSPFVGSSVTIILAVCILVVVILIGFSVYGMFHHSRPADEEGDEDDYYEDDYYDDSTYGDDAYDEDAYDEDVYDNASYGDDAHDVSYYETSASEGDNLPEENSISPKNNACHEGNEYHDEYGTMANNTILQDDDDLYIEDLSADDSYAEDSYPADNNDVFDEDEYDN